jgi:hypothetical protein
LLISEKLPKDNQSVRGVLKSGKQYQSSEQNRRRELQSHQGMNSELGSDEHIAEVLTDVDRPSKERQKVLAVDYTPAALGKAKQQLYHMTKMPIHPVYYSVLMNWSGWRMGIEEPGAYQSMA